LPQSVKGLLDSSFRRVEAATATASRVNRLSFSLDAWLLRRSGLAACLLWFALVLVYQIDDSVVEEGDAIANVELPITLLRTGSLHFTPRLSPIVFRWRSLPPLEEREDYYVRSWHERHAGKAAGFWYATGHLLLNGPRYFAVESPVRDAYVCTFGVIAGMTFLPMAALLGAVHPDFMRSEWLKLSAAKLHASGLIATSAVLIFLLGLRYVRPRHALLVAVAYALGTCVWAVSSETLWQQTVNIALLSGVIYAFVRVVEDDSRPARVLCGVLLGAALASRPTAAFSAIAVAVYVWRHRRGALATIVVAAMPIPLAVALYNQYYFGSPINIAQELVGHRIAFLKTGAADIWQTPLIVGMTGLLISPSRGLLVFSPFLFASLVGVRRLWRDPSYASLRPLTLAAAATMLVQCKWFDWWGGWTYGYRPWLEAVPVLALCLLPVIEAIFSRRWLASLFLVALAWSVFVQGLGAFAYDKQWNARDLFRVDSDGLDAEPAFFVREADARRYADRTEAHYAGLFSCNIDLPVCRYRLWSIEDSIIAYYVGERYAIARSNRKHARFEDLLNQP
jgi:hypothetical protein